MVLVKMKEIAEAYLGKVRFYKLTKAIFNLLRLLLSNILNALS